MATEKAIFTAETFRFFCELKRNNSKAWMDENHHRCKTHVVELFRRLLDALTPRARHGLHLPAARHGKSILVCPSAQKIRAKIRLLLVYQRKRQMGQEVWLATRRQRMEKAEGWIVRKRFPASTALRSTFARDIDRVFRQLFSLYSFSSLQQWKP